MVLGYPKILGNEIIFDESGDSRYVDEKRRPLKPLVIEGMTEEEYNWMNGNAKGHVIVSSYQGTSCQSYELIRNLVTGQVALKWQGMLMLDPMQTLAIHFYDGLTHEVDRLQYALEKHREGLQSGWGDTNIPDSAMPR